MKFQSFSSLFMVAVFSAAVFISCKKNNDAKTNVQITSISPDSGSYLTMVTIIGTGFSTNASENQVKFNGKDAIIQTASLTQLTVIVPNASGTGPVTVMVGNKSATGPVFNYRFNIPVRGNWIIKTNEK